MRRAIFIFVAFALAARAPQAFGGRTALPQSARVVDRIVARIEGDIILQSQLRELGALQQLIDGRAESDEKLLDELIEQWVVQTEATGAHFPQPAQSEVDRELQRLQANFGSPEKYAARLNELGLTPDQVRRLLIRQINVERYVDYKFRPSVQVEPADIDAYYKNELLPELAKKNQPKPARSAVEEQIREVLTQRQISDLTGKWLDDTKSRLKIEIEFAKPKP
jgi:parvulin-like peptidyl-prolyl isomerase